MGWGDVPPPLHAWMAPIVEDMHSMGEGLKADEARDAAFILTGAGMWVGKSAYLTTDPMTIQVRQKGHCPGHIG